jgi:hypothetical protein
MSKHTQGPVVAVLITIDDPEINVEPEWRITQPDGCWLATAWIGVGDDPNDEAKANAELIAEAFNVAHETGLTPRQLVKLIGDSACDALIYTNKITAQRDELLTALTEINSDKVCDVSTYIRLSDYNNEKATK